LCALLLLVRARTLGNIGGTRFGGNQGCKTRPQPCKPHVSAEIVLWITSFALHGIYRAWSNELLTVCRPSSKRVNRANMGRGCPWAQDDDIDVYQRGPPTSRGPNKPINVLSSDSIPALRPIKAPQHSGPPWAADDDLKIEPKNRLFHARTSHATHCTGLAGSIKFHPAFKVVGAVSLRRTSVSLLLLNMMPHVGRTYAVSGHEVRGHSREAIHPDTSSYP